MTHVYMLRYYDENDIPTREIEFESADANQAFFRAERDAGSSKVELWQDGRRLCFMQKSIEDGLWTVRDER